MLLTLHFEVDGGRGHSETDLDFSIWALNFFLLLPILYSLLRHRRSFEAVWADLLGDILGTTLYLDETPFLHLQRLQPRDL